MTELGSISPNFYFLVILRVYVKNHEVKNLFCSIDWKWLTNPFDLEWPKKLSRSSYSHFSGLVGFKGSRNIIINDHALQVLILPRVWLGSWIFFWPYIEISDLRWPSNWHISMAIVKSFILTDNQSMFGKVQNMSFFDLFSRFLTFGDLKTNFFETIRLKFDLSSGFLTSHDLATTFFRALLAYVKGVFLI